MPWGEGRFLYALTRQLNRAIKLALSNRLRSTPCPIRNSSSARLTFLIRRPSQISHSTPGSALPDSKIAGLLSLNSNQEMSAIIDSFGVLRTQRAAKTGLVKFRGALHLHSRVSISLYFSGEAAGSWRLEIGAKTTAGSASLLFWLLERLCLEMGLQKTRCHVIPCLDEER